MEGKELLLFQLGPVQEFIAQAAEVADLWAGSYLLSSLILAGEKKVPGWDDAERINKNFVFPNFTETTVIDAMEGKDRIPTIPNRFLAWVDAGKGEAVAEDVKKAIREELDELVAQFVPYAGAEDQARQFLSMTWAILPSSELKNDMGDNYKAIGRRLALRRNLREFDAWYENTNLKGNCKDFLSGKESALLDGPGGSERDSRYRRGAMNLLKLELAKKHGRQSLKKDSKEKYIAVLAMDGDRMGAVLSGLQQEKDHQDFSSRLAKFSVSVKDMLPEGCSLVYAGGDDVLAVVPAVRALEIAEELAERFAGAMKGITWKDENGQTREISASVGIAVGSVKMPLQDLVHAAHAAEHRAKTDYGRGAFAMSVIKRSGEILHWGGKWGGAGGELYHVLSHEFADMAKDVTQGFAHKLAGFLSLYGLDKGLSIGEGDIGKIIAAEVEHVCGRSEISSNVAMAAQNYVKEVFAGDCKRPQDFMVAFLCEDFINRPREED